ncbi:helix-turn-helix domain-containing protein [Tolypothrix sp. FACHB-123]|uniref:helix-turn-helix domain-containing protein n=1 Tax=Tolypothrix sp. FACHB-123 TaxID=2692868 RepID=UPI0016878D31|nr:helix-turn-helix domain-containing protein [Tolypothrix sp. FACHB-123]MBD2359232.1 helix-turn-helix domain-containing protein [Tolypothrix sp. FACHB-123]
MPKKEELTIIQARAIVLMIAGYSQRDIAIKLGITQTTISLWHRQSSFSENKRKAISTIFDASMADLIDGTQEAVRELRNIINDPETPQKTKISAITVLLSTALRYKGSNYIETDDLSDSVETKIKFLSENAESKEELKDVIALQQKQAALTYQTSKKLTVEESRDQIERLIKVIFEVTNEEQQVLIGKKLEELFKKLTEQAHY